MENTNIKEKVKSQEVNNNKPIKLEKEIKEVKSNYDFDTSVIDMVNRNHDRFMLEQRNLELETENKILRARIEREKNRKLARKKARKEFIVNLFFAAGIVMIAWFVISYFNVIANNLTTPEKIWDWNFFKVKKQGDILYMEVCKISSCFLQKCFDAKKHH